MRALHSYEVVPYLPPSLERLRELAYNIRWAWDVDTAELFARLERGLWDDSHRNPVRLLGQIGQQRLDAAARDEAFVGHLAEVCEDFDAAMNRHSWFDRGQRGDATIAYFSMEYGLAESLPIYSGGLGVLSGDHLKSANDLGIPLIAVGLMYQEGYFRQYLNPDGWQQELYPENDLTNMPVQLERRDGVPLTVAVPFPNGEIHARIWRIQVGRVPLFLLDTNTDLNNRPVDRGITNRLYAGDSELRIQQEIILGVGGVRALQALGYDPNVFHMNEGHSAFLAVERIRDLMAREGIDFDTAREVVSAGNVFTTHTPVPAGIDRFGEDLVLRYLGYMLPALGLSDQQLLDLGRSQEGRPGGPFSMAVLALRLSAYHNGVSELHSRVSQRMWCYLWPDAPCEEVPIEPITNGVHAPTWLSAEMKTLFDRYLGPRWREMPEEEKVWSHVEQIPATELWRTHVRRRERLVAFARRRMRKQVSRRGGTTKELATAFEVLDPEALTIGFARRFATYKRSTLLLADLDRLHRLLASADRPVQIIFAGKAHPADNPGKKLIKDIVHLARSEKYRHRILFLEDYDMAVARYLVQGVDVWLNTPRRPKEASGTSGMKAAMNGALNVSTLDGWWAEAFEPGVGWSIGSGEEYDDDEYGDRVEASALYDLLEKQVVPLFYRRGPDGVPRGWIDMMKASMQMTCRRFNTARMVRQYAVEAYLPSAERANDLFENEQKRARELVQWRRDVEHAWNDVRIVHVESDAVDERQVGHELTLSCRVHLGPLPTDQVSVELYHGSLDMRGELVRAERLPMSLSDSVQDGVAGYSATLPCHVSGRRGFSVRVLPAHPHLAHHLDSRKIVWG
jgi:glycogen phosphorylase